MNLRDVPDEEAEGVRALLDDLGVDWYEVPPTSFGLSAGSLWIREDAEFARAHEAYEDFQARYTERSRAASSEGTPTSQPLKLVGALLVSAIVLGFFFWPIVQLLN